MLFVSELRLFPFTVLPPSFLSSFLCLKANSCMLFPIFLFNQQYYSQLQASGGLTICHLRETRGKPLLNPGPPAFIKVPHAFQFFFCFFSPLLATIGGVNVKDNVKTKDHHWIPDHRGITSAERDVWAHCSARKMPGL